MIATMSSPNWNKSAYETMASPSFVIVRGHIPSAREGQPPIRYDSTFVITLYQAEATTSTVNRNSIMILSLYTKMKN